MPEPSSATLHRRTPANRLLSLFLVTRPAFLSASLLPVMVGVATAWREGGSLRWDLAILTLVSVGLIHAGANVLNDYFDARNGNDSHNRDRIYPFSGGSRFIQNGIYRENQMLHIALGLLAGGTVIGLVLVTSGGPVVLLLGVVGGGLAVAYSAPPCLACRGLGDLVIAVCFGVLPVTVAIYLQTGALSARAWWLGTSVGLFTAAILWINSIPDIEADRWAGKWTLPARLGARRARYGLAVLLLAGFAVLALSPDAGDTRLATLAAIPAVMAVVCLFRGNLPAAIALTLITHAAFCLLLVVAYTVSSRNHPLTPVHDSGVGVNATLSVPIDGAAKQNGSAVWNREFAKDHG